MLECEEAEIDHASGVDIWPDDSEDAAGLSWSLVVLAVIWGGSAGHDGILSDTRVVGQVTSSGAFETQVLRSVIKDRPQAMLLGRRYERKRDTEPGWEGTSCDERDEMGIRAATIHGS
jgi:hypothetical protein